MTLEKSDVRAEHTVGDTTSGKQLGLQTTSRPQSFLGSGLNLALAADTRRQTFNPRQ